MKSATAVSHWAHGMLSISHINCAGISLQLSDILRGFYNGARLEQQCPSQTER